VPPVADIWLEYAMLAVPETSEAEIVNAGGATTSERLLTDLVCAGLDESVTVKDRLVVPLAVGVPEIKPVDEFRLSQEGRLPDQM
jgi:hypothetical protein